MALSKFWLPATILNVALLSGANVVPALAGQSDPQSSIYGTWTLSYDWNCSGSPSSSTITFNNNGSFNNSGSTGYWSFAGDTIIFKYSNGTTYAGSEYSRTMKGRSTTYNSLNTLRGCWSASKTSTTSSQQVQSVSPVGPDGSKK